MKTSNWVLEVYTTGREDRPEKFVLPTRPDAFAEVERIARYGLYVSNNEAYTSITVTPYHAISKIELREVPATTETQAE